MHVALVAQVPLPPVPQPAELEDAASRLEGLVEDAGRYPLAVRAPSLLLSFLARHRPDLSARLAATRWEWLRGGHVATPLALLPESGRRLALHRELEVTNALDLRSEGAWLEGPWDPTLVQTLRTAGCRHLLVPEEQLARFSGWRPGVVRRHGEALAAMVVRAAPAGLPAAAADPDGVAVWKLEPEEVTRWAEEVSTRPGWCLTTPSAYLLDHPPVGTMPLQTGELQVPEEAELLYAKCVALLAQLPERFPTEGVDALLSVLDTGVLRPDPPADRMLAAHRTVAELRPRLEAARSRGDGWGVLRRRDWDADAVEDLVVESHLLSFSLDPQDSCRLHYLDDKAAGWPVSAIPGAGRPSGWTLCRLVDADGEVVPSGLEVTTVREERQAVRLDMEGWVGEGRLTCRLAVLGRRLSLRYRLEGAVPGRFGPEITLAMASVAARVRIDGSEWRPVIQPLSAAGHRFRLADDIHEVLLAVMTPALFHVGPLVPYGLVAWPHWETPGSGHYELRVDLAP